MKSDLSSVIAGSSGTSFTGNATIATIDGLKAYESAANGCFDIIMSFVTGTGVTVSFQNLIKSFDNVLNYIGPLSNQFNSPFVQGVNVKVYIARMQIVVFILKVAAFAESVLSTIFDILGPIGNPISAVVGALSPLW